MGKLKKIIISDIFEKIDLFLQILSKLDSFIPSKKSATELSTTDENRRKIAENEVREIEEESDNEDDDVVASREESKLKQLANLQKGNFEFCTLLIQQKIPQQEQNEFLSVFKALRGKI